jgi:hypothetical protein
MRLLSAFNDAGFLEALTGLDKLHAESEQALEAADWEKEETDEDFECARSNERRITVRLMNYQKVTERVGNLLEYQILRRR